MSTHHSRTAAKRGSTWAVACLAILATPGLLGCGWVPGGVRPALSCGPMVPSPARSTRGAAAAAPPPVPAAAQESHLEAVPSDSLPPDVAVIAADSVAAPGATVELTAQASPDVVEVFLYDGVGRKQSLDFDSSTNVWHARYRVPLGISAERLGVSVTAKNGVGLRHRVWTFLRIDRGANGETPATEPPAVEREGEAEPDSSGS